MPHPFSSLCNMFPSLHMPHPLDYYHYAICFHIYTYANCSFSTICPLPFITMPPIPLTTVSATISMTTLPWLLCPFFITTVSINMPLFPLFHTLLPMHTLSPRLPSSLFFCFYAISCFILICCPVKGLLVSSLLHNHLLALYYKYHLVFPESLFPISSLGIKKYCLALVIVSLEAIIVTYFTYLVYTSNNNGQIRYNTLQQGNWIK